MKLFKKEYLIYHLFSITSIAFVLILDIVLKSLLKIFSLYINDYFNFEILHVIFIHTYFFVTPYLFFKIFKKVRLKFSRFLLVFVVYNFIFHLIGYLISSPILLIFLLSTVLYAYLPLILGYFTLVDHAKVSKKIVSLFIFLLLTYFNLNYTNKLMLQKQNFSSISGVYSKQIDLNSIDFINQNGEIINLKKDVVLLDFWTNTCGICIKKFPKVESVIKSLDHQTFYFVNVIDDESQMEKAKEILRVNNVNSKNLFIHKNQLSKFDVSVFPTFIKIENGEIVFKGMIETFSYFNLVENL